MRVLLDARLAEWGARLDASAYEDALSYLVQKCWELSGLDASGRPRRVWYVHVTFDVVREIEEGSVSGIVLGHYASEERAKEAADSYLEGDPGAILELVEGSPPGAYDAELGLSFSTYSRRILSARVVDWYRATFGDARYGTRQRELSLDALVEQWERNDGSGADDSYLDRRGPGARLEFIDDLNRHAHDDPTEEVLTRVALGS